MIHTITSQYLQAEVALVLYLNDNLQDGHEVLVTHEPVPQTDHIHMDDGVLVLVLADQVMELSPAQNLVDIQLVILRSPPVKVVLLPLVLHRLMESVVLLSIVPQVRQVVNLVCQKKAIHEDVILIGLVMGLMVDLQHLVLMQLDVSRLINSSEPQKVK